MRRDAARSAICAADPARVETADQLHGLDRSGRASRAAIRRLVEAGNRPTATRCTPSPCCASRRLPQSMGARGVFSTFVARKTKEEPLASTPAPRRRSTSGSKGDVAPCSSVTTRRHSSPRLTQIAAARRAVRRRTLVDIAFFTFLILGVEHMRCCRRDRDERDGSVRHALDAQPGRRDRVGRAVRSGDQAVARQLDRRRDRRRGGRCRTG